MPRCSCGRDNVTGKFCPSCGSRLRTQSTDDQETRASRQGSMRRSAATDVRSSLKRSESVTRSSSSSPLKQRPAASPSEPAPTTSVTMSKASVKLSSESNEVADLVATFQTRNSRKRDAMVSSSTSSQSRITVAVRKRPVNPNETPIDVISVPSLNGLHLLEPKQRLDGSRHIETHRFLFDEVFDETDNNSEVYQRTAKQLIDYVFDGGVCTCFAYGQTGSGKTFTLMGSGQAQQGIYIQAAEEVFRRLEPNLVVSVSFFEIYASKLYDLLNGKEQVFAREDENQKVHIRGLTEHRVADSKKLMQLVMKGLEGRSSNATTMNDESSRSHAILDIKLKLLKSNKEIGKLSVIDLAGSERASVSHAGDKQVQMEGAEINKSLLALKECIRALDQGQKHIPFRQSELTQILKESFIGENGHTMMIANISPSLDSASETLNTLRYAYRVKELKCDDTEPAAQGDSSRRESVDRGSGPVRVAPANIIRNAQGSLIQSDQEKPRCPGCNVEKRNIASLEAHKEGCGLVVVSCDYCNSSYKRKDTDKHSKSCAKFPVDCKQCGEKVPRENLKRHQTNECQKGDTSCLFCRMKLLRCDLEAHKTRCEQRTVECEECEAKVKFSQMSAHKRTCKRVPRSQQTATSTSPTPPAGNGGGSSSRSNSRPAVLEDEVPPEPTSNGVMHSPVASPTPAAPVPPPETLDDVPVMPQQSSPPAPPTASNTAADSATPAPPPGKPVPRTGNGAGVTTSHDVVIASTSSAVEIPLSKSPPQNSADNPCPLGHLGCRGGKQCTPEGHVQLLATALLTTQTLLSTVQSENRQLQTEVTMLGNRVQTLEVHNDVLKRQISSLEGK